MQGNSTRDALLASSEKLVRVRGYSAFSYADLAEAVGIRKASIHHHFPAKEDLGVGLIEIYRARFRDNLERIWAARPAARERLADYAALYRAGLKAGLGCLCGVFASEYAVLPKAMRQSVKAFFEEQVAWLERVLAEGRRRGEIRRDASAARQARMLLATLQGAMMIAHPLGDIDAFDHAVAAAFAAIEV